MSKDRLTVEALTPERWGDFQLLFGDRGAYAGCWCTWWHLPRKEFARGTKDGGVGNKRAMRRMVEEGVRPGVLVYLDGEVVAWVAIAPREAFSALERSRVYARLDDKPVWSVVCFYMKKEYRGAGLMQRALSAAVDYARTNGARLVEGYPVEPVKRMAAADRYMGVRSAFDKAGFKEVGRTPNGKPVMRRSVRPVRR